MPDDNSPDVSPDVPAGDDAETTETTPEGGDEA